MVNISVPPCVHLSNRYAARMAKKITLVDDIDETPADETVTFTIDGDTYEIDLSEKNAKKLRSSLAPFVEHGTRISSARKPRGGRSEVSDARAWLKANGHPVPDRGRIRPDLMEVYRNR
jgi:hypothetical protein